MNVFEDLIDELKEENLIEESVIEIHREKIENETVPESQAAQDTLPLEENTISPEETVNSSQEGEISSKLPESVNADLILPSQENDFYRRRAMEEVSALQMVERVISGVEREYLKIIPKAYDDIPVSKALHDFLQVAKNTANSENAAAEFKLMQETESWYSALSHRDQNILPAQLRRFCETTRPVLSSQALAALARFYRNSPFSENVRSKYDLIVTRLFSREFSNEKRELLLELNEISQQLSDLYADWSSVSLYSTDDDSQLTIFALKFEDFITEAASAESFEELIKNDFFNRLRAFKVSTGENFYAPQVTSTAIKCNIFVGNRFVELIQKELAGNNADALENKYKFLHDQSISEAASKTLQLIELLHNKNTNKEPENIHQEVSVSDTPKREKPVVKSNKVKNSGNPSGFFSFDFVVNKWLLGLMILTVFACAGLYSWVEFGIPQPSTENVTKLELDGYYFKDYLKVAKITNGTLIAVTKPSWDSTEEAKKQEVLKNILVLGKDKAYRSVRLLNNNGITVGYISEDSINEANTK